MENITTTASFPASYPLGTLREYPSEWMLDLMVDLYQGQIVGSHGFGFTHPRARWMTLIVSDREECPCGDLGRWEDGTVLRGDGSATVWCSRCAEAEIALVAAERLRRASAVPHAVPAYETEPTVVEPFVRDADLPRLGALTLLCALVLAMLSAASGCATSSRTTADAPETVGNLSASYRSIAVAPIHASTDLTPSFGAVEGDDTATSEVTTVSRAPDAGEPDALPEVAPKTDGVTTGAAR